MLAVPVPDVSVSLASPSKSKATSTGDGTWSLTPEAVNSTDEPVARPNVMSIVYEYVEWLVRVIVPVMSFPS